MKNILVYDDDEKLLEIIAQNNDCTVADLISEFLDMLENDIKNNYDCTNTYLE